MSSKWKLFHFSDLLLRRQSCHTKKICRTLIFLFVLHYSVQNTCAVIVSTFNIHNNNNILAFTESNRFDYVCVVCT